MEGCVGEESFQLWELNRRLEAYLTRVKTLEEQNQLLSAELGGLRAQSGDASWRARADDELAALRVLVDQRWREKHEAEVQRDNLAEELEGVAGRCQQVRLARERTSEEAACSRRALEAEKSAQGWLSSRVAELEREVEAVRAAHEEERAHLNAQAACAPRRLPVPPRGPPARVPEVEELARRLGEAWRGAVRGYQERVAHMESSLGQARERLGRAVRGAREGRLELQQLQAERDGLLERREALEQRLEGRWQDRLQATEKFQLAVDALEQEKQGLQSQIAQILEGGQQLAHLKMSLSLEVATYRTLLEAENSRLQTPGRGSQASLGFQGKRRSQLLLEVPPFTLKIPFLSSTNQSKSLLCGSNHTDVPSLASGGQRKWLVYSGQGEGCSVVRSGHTYSVSYSALPDPKLKLHFLGTPEDQHLGSVLPVLSPTPLPSPLPDTLETPVTPFLKTQEFLQAQTPTLASTPIPPMTEAPFPTKAEVRAQDVPLSLLQTQGGRHQAPEPLWSEATAPVSTGVLEQLEEAGGKMEETLPFIGKENEEVMRSSEEKNLESLTAFKKESQPPLGCPEEEVQRVERLIEKEGQESLRSLEEEDQETYRPLEKENGEPLKSVEEEVQLVERLIEKEGQESLRSLEEEDQETYRPLEKENGEPLKSVEEELQLVERLIEKEGQESLGSLEEEDQETYRSLEKEEDQLVERLIEKEGQESLRFLEEEEQETYRPLEKEEDQETYRPLEKENGEPLKSVEEEVQLVERLIEKEGQESLGSLEEEDQETYRPLEKEDQKVERLIEKEDQESLSCLEEEEQETYRPLEKEDDQKFERLIEKGDQESLTCLEEEDQRIVKLLERENQESLRSLDENQDTIMPLESKTQKPLKSLEVEEEQRIVKPLEKVSQGSIGSLEKENVELLGSLEDNDQMTESLLKKGTQESLGSHEDTNQETQDPQRFLEEEGQGIVKQLEKENQSFLGSLEEEQVVKRSLERENHEPLSSVEKKDQMTKSLLEKESQDSGKSLEEDQEAFRSLGKEDPESLQSLEEQDQEIQRYLQQETQQILGTLGSAQMASKLPENVGPELLKSLGNDQEIVRSLEEQNQESLVSLKETSVETVKSSEIENTEPLKNAEEDLEIINSIEAQESLWSTEVTRETTKPLEKEIQESLGFVDGNQEMLRPLDRENQELRSLGKWHLETVDSSEGMEEGRQRLEVEAVLETEEHQELLGSLEEGEQGLPGCVNQQGWEDMAVEHAAADQGPTLGRAGVESEDEAELPLSGQGEKKEGAEERERQLDAMGEAWSLEISEPQEQRVPSEEGSPGALQDLEGQPEQVGALEVPVGEGIPEVTEPLLQDEDIAQTGEQDSIEVTLGSENATRAELVLEQEVVGLGGPTHLAREEANHPSLGEESVEAKIAQDLEGSGKEPTEAGALESESSELPRASSDTLESKGCRESEPVVGWAVEEASVETSDHEGSGSPQPRPSETEGDEGTQAALAPPDPKLVEPCSPTPILEDACEQQPQADGIQEAGWQLEGGSEALERVEDEQEFGLGEIPEGLQDWEESREESEADELGETLPDSTPLGLYLRSPTSPKWDLAGEQRLSPQGEARKEGWGPAVLSNPSGEEEQGHDSDLSSEEFEDLGTEVSLLPGLPKEVPPVPEPECWDQGGESDGFADEEESGEEGEEGTESGAQWWGPGSSGGGFKVQHITQRGDLLEHESVGVSGPWDDDLRGATANISVTGLETESQDSAEPSGSEGSESVSSEGEDQVPDHLGAPQGVTNMVPVGGDTFGISGQGPRLESEHMNGRMENGLEQSEGQGVLDGHQDQEYPSQEQEVGALKAPLVGSAVHQGPSQSLEFPLSGVDGDSWSSGED
uniref:Nestin n=1 Tax=Cricetulus griseus TaxID=10029 RepID=A0A8C2LR45_CRIGR